MTFPTPPSPFGLVDVPCTKIVNDTTTSYLFDRRAGMTETIPGVNANDLTEIEREVLDVAPMVLGVTLADGVSQVYVPVCWFAEFIEPTGVFSAPNSTLHLLYPDSFDQGRIWPFDIDTNTWTAQVGRWLWVSILNSLIPYTDAAVTGMTSPVSIYTTNTQPEQAVRFDSLAYTGTERSVVPYPYWNTDQDLQSGMEKPGVILNWQDANNYISVTPYTDLGTLATVRIVLAGSTSTITVPADGWLNQQIGDDPATLFPVTQIGYVDYQQGGAGLQSNIAASLRVALFNKTLVLARDGLGSDLDDGVARSARINSAVVVVDLSAYDLPSGVALGGYATTDLVSGDLSNSDPASPGDLLTAGPLQDLQVQLLVAGTSVPPPVRFRQRDDGLGFDEGHARLNIASMTPNQPSSTQLNRAPRLPFGVPNTYS